MTDPAAPTTPACYRWEAIGGDCTRHYGPHKGFRCNGAIGRLIEVIHEGTAPPAEALDVERLAESLVAAGWDAHPIDAVRFASEVAAEYASLRSPKADR